MSVSNIYKLLDKLDEFLIRSLPVPMTPWIFVHFDKVTDSIDKIRASIPGEVQEAHGILKRADDIQLEAQRRANQILADAKHQADMLLSESELLNAVQAEADRIRQQVITDCEQIKKQAIEEAEAIKQQALKDVFNVKEGADRYAESVLANLDRDLGELHSIVKNGQKHLAKMRADSNAGLAAQFQNQQTGKIPVSHQKQAR